MINRIHNQNDLVDYDILCDIFIEILNDIEEDGNDEEDEPSVC